MQHQMFYRINATRLLTVIRKRMYSYMLQSMQCKLLIVT